MHGIKIKIRRPFVLIGLLIILELIFLSVGVLDDPDFSTAWFILFFWLAGFVFKEFRLDKG